MSETRMEGMTTSDNEETISPQDRLLRAKESLDMGRKQADIIEGLSDVALMETITRCAEFWPDLADKATTLLQRFKRNLEDQERKKADMEGRAVGDSDKQDMDWINRQTNNIRSDAYKFIGEVAHDLGQEQFSKLIGNYVQQ